MSTENLIPLLPTGRTTPPRTAVGRWLLSGGSLEAQHAEHKAHPWYLVLWLTGVDYFSSLGYQPGIALLAAGALSPLATILLILVTLFGALPIYAQVAARSYAGQGSIAMLENLLSGWWSKIFVLVLIGFGATDFVITMTLSAADAAQHAIENPLLHAHLGEARLAITIGLLALLAAVFLKGFTEAMGVAAAIAIPYLLLNVIVLVRGVYEIIHHPEALPNWQAALWQTVSLKGFTGWGGLFVLAAINFPKLALGMSGFETGVSVMPLVSGGEDEDQQQRHLHTPGRPPHGRIRATRKLLLAAALIMSVLLLLSSFVTTLLIPKSAYAGGAASGRAIAYLAHELLGNAFGTVYDISTILILWFAGASAMAGLLNLIPRYLPRFGMAPRWVAYRRPLVLVLFTVCVIVTWIFKADVEAQGGAYATGVLALMLSAAIAVALALRRKSADPRIGGETSVWLSNYFWLVAVVFAFTFIDNVIERHDGIIIASAFIFFVLVVSAISRYWRATELRVAEFTFDDETSKQLWEQIRGKKVNLVPLRTATAEHRRRKEEEIRRHYLVSGPLAFIHVSLLDNRSEFMSPLCLRVRREGDNYVIDVSGAIAIANTIAYISELIDPISIFVGLTRQNLMSQSFKFLLWGEGETGMMIYKILLRYWDWTPEDDVRPMIFLMSE
ncbi:MAG TPA: hypothetical protein VNQ79_03590 [Blastocatellia bacterium]|nr:hypothetical protein [Blastocatellia bacterium]